MYSDDESDPEVEDEGGLTPAADQSVDLPSLDDPDFAQFLAYLGVDMPKNVPGNTSTGSSTSTSEGSNSLSSFGSGAPSPVRGGALEKNVDHDESAESHRREQDGGSSSSGKRPLDKPKPLDQILLRIVQDAYVAPLPPNWMEYADDEGRIYFYNHVTEVSSWAHPTDRTYKELIQVGGDSYSFSGAGAF